MVVAVSILLLAVGALLWVLDDGAGGIDGRTIGVIVIALGGVGLLGTLLVSARAKSDRRGMQRVAQERIAAVEVEETAEDDSWLRPPHRQPPP